MANGNSEASNTAANRKNELILRQEQEARRKRNAYISRLMQELRRNEGEFESAIEGVKLEYIGKSDVIAQMREALSEGRKKQSGIAKVLYGDKNRDKDLAEAFKQYKEGRKELEEMYADEPEKREALLHFYDATKKPKGASEFGKEDVGAIGDIAKKMSKSLSSGLADALTDFENFGPKLKKIGGNMLEELIQMTSKTLFDKVFTEEKMEAAYGYGKAGFKRIGGTLSSFFKAIKPDNRTDGNSFIADLFKGKGESGGIFGKLCEIFSGKSGKLDKLAGFFTGKGGIVQRLAGIFNGGSMTGAAAGLVAPGSTGTEEPKNLLETLKNLLSKDGPLGTLIKGFGHIFSPDGPLGGLTSMIGNVVGGILGPNGLLSSILGPITGILGGGGLKTTTFGKSGNILTSLLSFIPFKFHSGGIMPSGANIELPGSKEQLALLKGGERVLSPSENTDYKSNPQQFNPTIVNLNIKSWDSRDVSKCFMENQDLLNSITFRGIKDNNCQLRQIVRNA